MFQSLLPRIDLFGTSVAMNFHKKEKIRSSFGGLCSLIFLSFVGWALYNGSKDFFSRQNPKIVNSETYNDNPRTTTITPENFPVAFGLQTPSSMLFDPYMDESIFKMDIVYNVQQKIKHLNGTIEEVWTHIPLVKEICTPDHFGSHYPSFADIDLNNLYCIARNQPDLDQVRVGGAFAAAVYEAVTITVSECTENNSLTLCAPEDVRNAYLAGGWFNALYMDMVVDPNNISHPDSRYRDIYSTMISPAIYKETDIELGHVDVSTDYGWLVQDIEMKNYTSVNNVKESLQTQPGPDKILIICSLIASNVETYYTRVYKKIQDVLAEVAGLSNAAFVAVLLIANPYSKLKFREALMNELFEVKAHRKGRRKKDKSASLKLTKTIEQVNNQNREALVNNEPEKRSDTPSQNHDLELPSYEQGLEKVIRRLSASSSSLNMPKKKSKLSSLHSRYSQISPAINFPALAEKNKSFYGSKSPDDSSRQLSMKKIISSKTDIGSENPPDDDSKSPYLQENSSTFKDVNLNEDSVSVSVSVQRYRKRGRTLVPINYKKSSAFTNESIICDMKSTEKEVNMDQSEENREGNREENREIEVEAEEENNGTPKDISQKQDITAQLNELEERNNPEESEQDSDEEKLTEKCKVIELSVWEYIASFIYQSKSLKAKMDLLKHGVKNIDDRLNVIHILKKLREVDKLKVLLLDDDELVLFNNMPKPVMNKEHGKQKIKKRLFEHGYAKKSVYASDNLNQEQVEVSHRRIREKPRKSEIDKKMLEIFNKKYGKSVFKDNSFF